MWIISDSGQTGQGMDPELVKGWLSLYLTFHNDQGWPEAPQILTSLLECSSTYVYHVNL